MNVHEPARYPQENWGQYVARRRASRRILIAATRGPKQPPLKISEVGMMTSMLARGYFLGQRVNKEKPPSRRDARRTASRGG